MNKLPKALTAPFFNNTAANYTGLTAHWRTLVNSKRKGDLGPEHHLLYQALRGKDWRKGFGPITNTVKLANGGYDNWALGRALALISATTTKPNSSRYSITQALLAPFDGLVTPAMLEQVKAMLPTSAYISDRTPERMVQANMLLEAYKVTAEQEALVEAAKAEVADQKALRLELTGLVPVSFLVTGE